MSEFYVSTDDTLGKLLTAGDPVEAARSHAAALNLPAGSVVTVRWNVRFYPRDPSMWLGASVREVSVDAAWVKGPEPAGEAAPPPKARKAKPEAPAAEPPAAPPAAEPPAAPAAEAPAAAPAATEGT